MEVMLIPIDANRAFVPTVEIVTNRWQIDYRNLAGYSGRLCSVLANDNGCPRDVYRLASAEWSTIHHTHHSVECAWRVEAPIGYNIEFELVEVSVPVIPGAVCSKDYVEIKFRDDIGLTGARFCHFGMSEK
ncbi:hypothetical protein PRIPAC_84981 [Pristionchus pacificus]|uniref:CUB domain-containing protein n=1 Tax=Pristionchus pacificus TaxID=54126 RepID=A0A2A6C9Y7_PRIPA|nr:hypothetical protein PRIPAC_84981 [Pristionchus pacificus]|eukprot:PDM74888.1 hypothetical protein PRIPAC_43378 [Pristionchus pacificus]